ncbi:MAG: xylulokinase [Phycisphaerae bacterium]|jgi:xylulokinase|nr:MAG: xylulokinase [Phycisphaerae bacterium]
MRLLGIDIGSSSVKSAILCGPGVPRNIQYAAFITRYTGNRAEVNVREIDRALRVVLRGIGPELHTIDAIAITNMAPSWLAMDARGKALTPVVTHQDRRSVDEARRIETVIGPQKHLRITGNLPFPGGISSTTWVWFSRHQEKLMKKADLVGHLSTWLIRNLCGARVTDPSNAAFMGVYQTVTLGGWSDDLVDALGLNPFLLPEVRESNVIAGHVSKQGARWLGLPEGVPVLTGCMDGSSAMLSAGARVGQMTNVSGSTDVLAVLVDRPRPDPELLTRPLGVGKRWLAVSTLSAAGSAIDWVRRTFYSEMDEPSFYDRLRRVVGRETTVVVEPDLAGSRTRMDDPTACIKGLRIGHTRDDILAAFCQALARQSANRLVLLKKKCQTILPTVVMTGGTQKGLEKLLHREWNFHGSWSFRHQEQTTLRGLWKLTE